jgi:ecotin
MRPALLALLVTTLVAAPEATKRPDDDSHWQKAYPAAKAGQRRVVIHLEAKPDENDWKVEVLVGKTMMTDGVNHVGLGGRVEEKTVEGWGYTYLEAPESKGAWSTLIGVPPDKKPVETFVSYAPFGPFRYNSRLPVVVYVPQGYEVRYRFWKTATPYTQGEEG